MRIEARWQPATAAPGEEAELQLEVHVDASCHAYGRDEGTMTPVALPANDLQLDGLQAVAPAEIPPGKRVTAFGVDQHVLPSTFVVRQRVRVPSDWRGGDAEVRGALAYQLCDDAQCFPPARLPFSARLSIRGSSATAGTR